MIGSTMAKLWVGAGHEVRLASRHPEALKDLVTALGPRASAGTAEQAAAFGEVVMLTDRCTRCRALRPTSRRRSPARS